MILLLFILKWLEIFSENFNLKDEILLPGGSLLGELGQKPKTTKPFYVNFNEALINTKYAKLFKGKSAIGSVTMNDIRIHVSDFRCVMTDFSCVVPHNQNAGLMDSTTIAPYTLLDQREFWQKVKSLDAFPGDVISMDVVIRGYRETVVGGASQIFVHPLAMKILEQEMFKFVDGKLK